MNNPPRLLLAATLLALALSTAAETAFSADQGPSRPDQAGPMPKWLQDYLSGPIKSVEDLQQRNEKMRPHWNEFEKIRDKRTAELCGAPGISPVNLMPKVIYAGSIEGWAASPNGVVAVADPPKRQIIVFPMGIDGPERRVPLARESFVLGELQISNDGRYLAWLDGWNDQIYDVLSDHLVWSTDDVESNIFTQQWFGDSLLIEEPHKNELLLVTNEGNRFLEAVLTKDWYPTNVVDPIKAGLVAWADQLGQSFLRNDSVYTTMFAVTGDKGVVEVHRTGRVYRAGDRVLRLLLPDPYEQAHHLKLPTFELHDGDSGVKLLVEPVAYDCVPRNIVATGDGESFAMLTGIETIAIRDRRDLSINSLYNLISPSGAMAQPYAIAFLPDNRIVVGSQESPSKNWLLVYDPAHPN